MTRCVERFEDMSPIGRLRLYCQDDGDLIVEVIDSNENFAHVEFCMPMTGGGQSEHTHAALRHLMVAMAKDELLRKQTREHPNGAKIETSSDPAQDLQVWIARAGEL